MCPVVAAQLHVATGEPIRFRPGPCLEPVHAGSEIPRGISTVPVKMALKKPPLKPLAAIKTEARPCPKDQPEHARLCADLQISGRLAATMLRLGRAPKICAPGEDSSG